MTTPVVTKEILGASTRKKAKKDDSPEDVSSVLSGIKFLRCKILLMIFFRWFGRKQTLYWHPRGAKIYFGQWLGPCGASKDVIQVTSKGYCEQYSGAVPWPSQEATGYGGIEEGSCSGGDQGCGGVFQCEPRLPAPL